MLREQRSTVMMCRTQWHPDDKERHSFNRVKDAVMDELNNEIESRLAAKISVIAAAHRIAQPRIWGRYNID